MQESFDINEFIDELLLRYSRNKENNEIEERNVGIIRKCIEEEANKVISPSVKSIDKRYPFAPSVQPSSYLVAVEQYIASKISAPEIVSHITLDAFEKIFYEDLRQSEANHDKDKKPSPKKSAMQLSVLKNWIFNLYGVDDLFALELIKDNPEVFNVDPKSITLESEFSLNLWYRAKRDEAIMLVGETGTSKQSIARIVQLVSHRRRGPFVQINCTAISAELLESELFGHVKGAFTGAIAKRVGKLEHANKGTVFLDELGKMHAHLQAKLLKVIEEKKITPVGSNIDKVIDVRFLATVQPADIKNGKIIPDLLNRLGNPDFVYLPPLRHRMVPAPHIPVDCSFKRALKEHGIKENEIKINPKVYHILAKFEFPGNYRELENILKMVIRKLIIAKRNEITPEDILSLSHLLTKKKNEDELVAGPDTVDELKNIQLKDIFDYANKRKVEFVEQKIKEVLKAGFSIKQALKIEGMPEMAYDGFNKKIHRITGKGIIDFEKELKALQQ